MRGGGRQALVGRRGIRHSLFAKIQLSFQCFFQPALFGGAHAFTQAMDPLTSAAASGLRARMESLDMLANNIANAATDAYKADRELYGTYLAPDAAAMARGQNDPMISEAPVIEKSWVDFSAGRMRTTDNPLHIALGAPSFLAVDGPSGTLYTRNGRLQLSAQGELLTTDGHKLRFADSAKVTIDTAQPFEISDDGTIMQKGQALGTLEIVRFDAASKLTKQGKNYFRAEDPAAGPRVDTDPKVHQGRLEDSNVTTSEAAVRLVSVMRQSEMLQKAIALGAEMNRRSIEEVARVTP